MATYAEVTEALGVILAHYPSGPELTSAHFKAYHGALEDIPIDLLSAAAQTIAVRNKFFPSAAELRQAAFALMEQANGVPGAYDAWGEVMKSFGPYGRHTGAPEWTHPLIGDAVDAIGGYITLCNSENTVADRSRFIAAYETLQKREREVTRMLPVVREAMARIAAGTKMPELEGQLDDDV